MTLGEQIHLFMSDKEEFTIQEAYELASDKPKTTVRARIYDNIGIKFEKLRKGVYRTINSEAQCIIIEGDGRDLSFLKDETIDGIITDHPWEDKKSNIGGSRKFTNQYDCFLYTLEDFKEKYRVLKPGCFLVEIIPAENENNYKYLHMIKLLAEKVGFNYYSKVAWKKGTFVSNTGRKAKNTEDVMIFSKGKARNLRVDEKKTKATGELQYMSGTNRMLPTMFDVQSISKKDKIHQSEKPIQLIQEILSHISLTNEWILDQFSGSGVVGEACLSMNRNSILIEILKENIEKIVSRLNAKDISL